MQRRVGASVDSFSVNSEEFFFLIYVGNVTLNLLITTILKTLFVHFNRFSALSKFFFNGEAKYNTKFETK